MRQRARLTGPALLTVLAVSTVGCGGGSGPGRGGRGSSTSPSAPAGPPALPTAAFTFGTSGLTPAAVRISPADGGAFTLTILSGDGRPHGVVITAGGSRSRIIVNPGATASRILRGVRTGRYRVVPDGATEPAVLIVGK